MAEIPFLNFNGTIFSSVEKILTSKNSAFRAGTGLIETMLIQEEQIPHMDAHYRRLVQGMQILRFTNPFSSEQFNLEVKKLLNANHGPESGILRLQVFPNSNQAVTDFLLEYLPMNSLRNEKGLGLMVGISKDVVMPNDSIANLKTSSRLRYNMASAEAERNNWDDALLLNQYDRITESTVSNIFWIKEETIHTPPLSEGCIAGVMRSLLLTNQYSDFHMEEKELTVKSLLDADEVFLTNAVRGIQSVQCCQNTFYKNERTTALATIYKRTIS